MFYTFSQNNSGGFFKPPAIHVIVEADSAKEANEIAEENGLYFDGVRDGVDCSCCGDRWSDMWGDEKGDEIPMIYGEPVEQYKSEMYSRWAEERCIPVYVIYRK
jgi:hypothetical protein